MPLWHSQWFQKQGKTTQSEEAVSKGITTVGNTEGEDIRRIMRLVAQKHKATYGAQIAREKFTFQAHGYWGGTPGSCGI